MYMVSLWNLQKYCGLCREGSGGFKLRKEIWNRKKDFGIINILMVLTVMTLNEITQEECEKQEK